MRTPAVMIMTPLAAKGPALQKIMIIFQDTFRKPLYEGDASSQTYIG